MGELVRFTRCSMCRTFARMLEMMDYECSECTLARLNERDRQWRIRFQEQSLRNVRILAWSIPIAIGLWLLWNILLLKVRT